jgi:arylamine N-acetyltransferase
MVNFVMIEGKMYMVDVGFGAPGPILPLPLEERVEHSNIYPASARLVRGHIGPLVRRSDSQHLWIYQHRMKHANHVPSSSNPSEDTNHDGWRDTYAFSDLEFIPADFESLTVASAFRRNSFFNYTIAAARMIMAHEVPLISANFSGNSHVRAALERSAGRSVPQTDTHGDDGIVGVMALTTTECKCTINGYKITLKTFEHEEDRLEALRTYFGIEFSESEKAGVYESAVSFDRVQF